MSKLSKENIAVTELSKAIRLLEGGNETQVQKAIGILEVTKAFLDDALPF